MPAQHTTPAPVAKASGPPVIEACRALGLSETTLAGLLGVSHVAVNGWMHGRRPIPLRRHLALLFLAGRLVGVIGGRAPMPATRYARRSEVRRRTAEMWLRLARQELEEDTRGIYRAEDLRAGTEMGQAALRKLEAT